MPARWRIEKRRSYWLLFAGLLCLAGFATWRARRPEFAFLGGHESKRVAGALGSTDVMAFKADPDDVIREADAQLTAPNWHRVDQTEPLAIGPDDQPRDIEIVAYIEKGGLGRVLSIDKDCADPVTYAGFDPSTDYVRVASYRQGWVGITIVRPNRPYGFFDRVRQWLDKVFLGSP